MTLHAGYMELAADELVEFLLQETGQVEQGSTNPATVLEYLKLQPVLIDLETELPGQRLKPRGVLDFRERIVGVQYDLMEQRARFTVLHEIGHYVLPTHQNELYICDDADLSVWTRNGYEREANTFAADLLFQGDRFTLEANSLPLNAATVKELSGKYGASFEATARRLVESNFTPCMLAVCARKADSSVIDPSQPPAWTVRYSIASPSFGNQYFYQVNGDVPGDLAAQVTRPGRDIADSLRQSLVIDAPHGGRYEVEAEFFSNTYNIFCFLTRPKPMASRN